LYKIAYGVSLDVLAAVVWSRDIQTNTTRGFI